MKRLLSIFAFATALAVPSLRAQTTVAAVPAFDVISVKQDKTNSGMTSLRLTPDGFNADNVVVHMLLSEGYQLNEDQIFGEPGWMKTDHFDVQAKVAGADVVSLAKLTFNQRRAMFKQILAEQFKLETHTETRQLPVYVLTVAKGGLKFKEHVPDPKHPEYENGQGNFTVDRDRIVTQGTTMTYFLSFLSQQAGRTFLDKSGLTGRYDIDLHWTPDEGAAPPRTKADGTGAPAGDSGPSLLTAIQEQLGLKLEAGKGPVEVQVIDHIERPAEN